MEKSTEDYLTITLLMQGKVRDQINRLELLIEPILIDLFRFVLKEVGSIIGKVKCFVETVCIRRQLLFRFQI